MDVAFPRSRVLPYLMLLLAGLCLAVYQPPSAQAITFVGLTWLWHLLLTVGGLGAVVGAISRREVIEVVGLTLVVGALTAYAGLLGYAAWHQPWPDLLATVGVALIIGSGAGILAVVAHSTWRIVQAGRT